MAKRTIPTDVLARTDAAPKKKNLRRTKAEKSPQDPIMRRMTLILRDDQLKWLRLQAFEAQNREDNRRDMSRIIRDLIDQAMR